MAQLTRFAIGQGSPANTFLAVWMAQEADLYKAQGLDAYIVPMIGGKDSASEFAAGRLQAMHIGMSSVVRANTAGADLVTIGSLSNIIRNTLFAAPHIKSAAELKGGTVGISSAGSESDPIVSLALGRIGLKRDDVKIKEIGVHRLTAVQTGKVDATVLGEPHRTEAFEAGLLALLDLYGEKVPWLYSGLVVSRRYLREHRPEVLAFMKATIEGNRIAITDAARAKAVLARELDLTPPALIDATYDNFKAATPLNAELSRAGAGNVVAYNIVLNASRKVEDYTDPSVGEELVASGFIAEMDKKYGARRENRE
jgi:ABC-type nitrate/sulfonate/bicarbonate transport system substrate-binding protein